MLIDLVLKLSIDDTGERRPEATRSNPQDVFSIKPLPRRWYRFLIPPKQGRFLHPGQATRVPLGPMPNTQHLKQTTLILKNESDRGILRS